VKTISILSRKGGVGKTLCAMGFAQALSAHHRVAVLDLDPEGSARAWALNAKADGIELGFQVLSPVEAAQMGKMDFLVVDTPPNDAKTLASTAKDSDVMFLPLQPGRGEIDRLEPSIEVIRNGNFKKGAQLGIILNFVEHDNLSSAMPQALETLGYPLVARIRKGVEYRRSFGALIPDPLLEPFKSALEEVGISGR
jgi:chromosome partitioning protein